MLIITASVDFMYIIIIGILFKSGYILTSSITNKTRKVCQLSYLTNNLVNIPLN